MPTDTKENQQPGVSGIQTETLLTNLGDLSDEQFFQRLSALRAEHKRTLLHYEKLYHEKLMAETGGDIGMVFGEPLFAPSSERQETAGERETLSSLSVNGVGLDLTARTSPNKNDVQEETAEEEPVDLATVDLGPLEPSRLDTMGRDYNLSVEEPVNTGSDTFNHSLEYVRMSAEKPPKSPCPRHGQKQAWTEDNETPEQAPAEIDETTDNRLEETERLAYDETRYQKARDAALDRIETMWSDFRIDEYDKTRRKSTDRPKTAEDWRHKITMPKPFQMTLRDESKARTKSRTLAEYEHQRAIKEMEERFECEKKFRAAPVPAHVYLPLYEELMEKSETKRRTNVQIAKDVLKSQEKPFKFNERQKKVPDHGRRHSAPIYKHKQFKAKPIPKSIKADVSERILEEEEYRKIRIRMRSKELLRSSALPPRMASNEQYTVGKLKEKLEKETPTQTQKKFHPRIKKKVPDFDRIHRRQQTAGAKLTHQRPEPRVVTVCEPFNFRSTSIPSNMDKVIKDMENDEENLVENRWPYKNPRAKPKLGEVRRSYDALPASTTTATELRNSKNFDELRKRTSRDQDSEKAKERQDEMARQRRKQIAEKARANDQTQSLKASNAERLRKFREEERVRLEEYRRELAEMEARVNKQPFLFERQSQLNARKRAEKRFEDALRDAGVDDDSLHTLTAKGPRSPEEVSNFSDDDLPADGDGNATYDATPMAADDDDDDFHYSHSFVDDDDEEEIEEEDDLTKVSAPSEDLSEEVAA